MQTLYYTSASASLVLQPDTQQNSPSYWYNVTSLVTSASLYQIIAFSGSTPIAYFPVNSTNVFLDYFPAVTPTVTGDDQVIAGVIAYQLTSNYTGLSEGSSSLYFKQSNGNQVYLTGGLDYEDYGLITAYSGGIEYYLSASQPTIAPWGLIDYSASVIIKDIAAGTIPLTDNRLNTAPTGALAFGTGSINYQVTMSVYYFVPV